MIKEWVSIGSVIFSVIMKFKGIWQFGCVICKVTAKNGWLCQYASVLEVWFNNGAAKLLAMGHITLTVHLHLLF
jgi:nitrate reductase beta subunit